MIYSANEIKSSQDFESEFRRFFLSNDKESLEVYQKSIHNVASLIANQIQNQEKPYVGKSPLELNTLLDNITLLPNTGTSIDDLIENVRTLVIESNINVFHPHCLAHLHCPTFIISLVAELIISAFNQSMDSWDQSPAATMIEQKLCEELCKFFGFTHKADAVFTGGGTMSNFMGLLLARDHFCQTTYNWDVKLNGLHPNSSKFRILCAENAHFTVAQSISILGLGENAVVKVQSSSLEECADCLDQTITELKAEGLIPIAYVSTAGTTDFGSMGNIEAISKVVHKHSMWLHVDAAYGGALMFSEKHRDKLKGIEKADSLTIDFHKLFYQPISCGVFIVKNKESFRYIKMHADYLNPEGNAALGILDLVDKSIQTTRRFDALKPFLAFQHIGIDNLGKMVDHTIEISAKISELIADDSDFELAYKTPINAIVFRYLPPNMLNEAVIDKINHTIKHDMLLTGEAIIGQTIYKNKAFLKFTILNPVTTIGDIKLVLKNIKLRGIALTNSLKKSNFVMKD
jgi:L-2,4-diaminobutyrate decarboxylase